MTSDVTRVGRRTYWSSVVRGDARLMIGTLLTAVIVIGAVVSIFWTPFDPAFVDSSSPLLPALTDGHVLGTDQLGRDILSQLMVGARNSLQVALIGTGAALLAGVAIGGSVAFFGNAAEEGVMRLADVTLAFPTVLLGAIIVARIGGGNLAVILAVAISFTPIVTRLTRGSTKEVLSREFITAARTFGRGNVSIFFRYVIPNITGILLVQMSVLISLAFLSEAALSFLGLGVQPPDPSWGRMLRDSQSYAQSAPQLALWPGLSIVITVLGLNLVAEGLRDVWRLDPR